MNSDNHHIENPERENHEEGATIFCLNGLLNKVLFSEIFLCPNVTELTSHIQQNRQVSAR